MQGQNITLLLKRLSSLVGLVLIELRESGSMRAANAPSTRGWKRARAGGTVGSGGRGVALLMPFTLYQHTACHEQHTAFPPIKHPITQRSGAQARTQGEMHFKNEGNSGAFEVVCSHSIAHLALIIVINRENAMRGPRFEQTCQELQPMPLSAMQMISEEPIRLVEERIASCNGGKSRF